MTANKMQVVVFCLVVLIGYFSQCVESFSAVAMPRSTTGIVLTPLDGGKQVLLDDYLQNPTGRSLFVFGTYAADFNAIEYVQRLRY